MRRIPVVMVTPDMKLARDIWGRNGMLLAKGTDKLMNYRDKLILNGIASLYVEDGLGEDIYDEEVVCEETRKKCVDLLSDTMAEARHTGAVDMEDVDNIISSIIEDMLARPDMALGLSDIMTSSSATLHHSIDATIYSLFLGKLVGLDDMQLEIIGKGALLHDIGKIALDPNVLYKNGFLNCEERKHVECHAKWGYRMLEEEDWLESPAREIALLHHERMDGSGYPYGLKGKDIPFMARIVAIADVYDALTSERSYKPAMSNEKAINVLNEDAKNGKLDEELVDKFVSRLAVYPNGIVVLLSNGEPAIVKAQNKSALRRPVVRIIDFKQREAFVKRDCDLTEEWDIDIVKSDIKVNDLPDEIRCQFF